MARMRRGIGGANLTLPLIIFVFIALFATILAIVFFNQAGKAEVELQKTKDAKAKYILGSEEGAFTQAHADIKPSGTVSYAGQLDKDIKELKQSITGNGQVTMDLLRTQIKERAKGAEGAPLLSYIEALDANKTAAEAKVATDEVDMKKAQDRVVEVEKEKTDLADQYKKSLDANKAAFTDQVSALQDQLAKANANLDSLTKQRDQNMVEIQGKLKEQENKGGQLELENRQLKQRVAELLPKKGGSLEVPDTSLQPKGSIASILQDENLVYIDRGRKQHVVPGMTFAVFDHSTGISKDEHGQLRGKAIIEVVSTSDDSAVCRIVERTPRKSIIEGDVLANAVYDPNYKYKFMVYGDFDIDNQGIAGQADRQRIKTTIAEWGGTLTDELTYDTDFLVLGQEPKLPDALPKDNPDKPPDPELIRRHTVALEKYNAYKQLEKDAKALSIPVLNQNRFLALIGYYKR